MPTEGAPQLKPLPFVHPLVLLLRILDIATFCASRCSPTDLLPPEGSDGSLWSNTILGGLHFLPPCMSANRLAQCGVLAGGTIVLVLLKSSKHAYLLTAQEEGSSFSNVDMPKSVVLNDSKSHVVFELEQTFGLTANVRHCFTHAFRTIVGLPWKS